MTINEFEFEMIGLQAGVENGDMTAEEARQRAEELQKEYMEDLRNSLSFSWEVSDELKASTNAALDEFNKFPTAFNVNVPTAQMFGPFGAPKQTSASTQPQQPQTATAANQQAAKAPARAQHVRSYTISFQDMMKLLTEPTKWQVKNAPPADAEITIAAISHEACFTLEHITFEQVPEGGTMKEIRMTLEPAPPPEPQERSSRGYEWL